MRDRLWKIAAALGAVYVIWGSTFLAIRFAIETIPPFLMAASRFLVAGSLLYAWARATGAPRPTRVEWRSTAAIGAFLLFGGNGGVVWAEQRVASGIAALLITTEPLWIVLLGWLRPGGRRPDWRVAAGLLLGFAGTVLLVLPGFDGGQGIYPLGALVLVLASLSWAWGSLRSTWAPLPASPLLTTGMQMLAGGGLLLLAGLISGEPARLELAAVSGRSLLALLFLIVFGSIIAFSAYVWLLRAAPPTLVSTYAYVNPVVAVLLGWAFAGEALTATTLVAAAVIVTGVAVITTAPRAPAIAAAAAVPAPELEERAAA